jgi:isopenicillin N synthase-like dioxygenase
MSGIPVIDLAQNDDEAIRHAIDEACREWGFFQVIGHGIDSALLDALRRQMRAFFAQPRAAKQVVARSEVNPWGYYDRELTKNTRDWKELFDFAAANCGRSVPRWPADLPGFRDTLIDYYRGCAAVAVRLLHVVSANLGLPPTALDRHFAHGHSSWARLNYYPTCVNPERPDGLATPTSGHLGVNHHTDPGVITVVLQDQPGLEVFRRGQWTLVEPVMDALVINLGDIVQVWSNDRYQAPLHRVLANASVERFSAAFFFCPPYEMDYAPLAPTVDERNPAHYRDINWGRFYSMRTLGDYADHGEEIQISQFRR